MSNIYEFIIRAKDEASKVLTEVGGNIGAAGKNWKSQFSSLSGASSTLALGLGGLTVAAGVFGKSALDRASEMENLSAQFKTFTKSGDTALALMKDINKFAASTPFETVELADASKQLLAFGVGADDVIGSLQTLGDVASATGQPIGELAYLYGTTRTQGRLYGQDLLQFTGRGIPLIKELAKQFNVSESEVKKLVEQGKVGFPEVQKALQSMTTEGGMFQGGMLAQSKTFSGMMSTFSDSIGLAMAEVGTSLLPMFKSVLGAMIEFANNLPAMAKGFVDFATALINNKPALIGIAAALATVLAPAAISAAIALWAAVSPMLTLVAIAAAVGLAVYALYTAWETNFLGIQDIVAGAVAIITPIWNGLVATFMTTLEMMRPIWDQLTATISVHFTSIQAIFMEMVALFTVTFNTIRSIVEPTIAAIVSFIQTNWESISQYLNGSLNVVKGVFQTIWAAINGIVQAALSLLRGDTDGAMKAIEGMIKGVWEGLKTFIGGILDQITGLVTLAYDTINNLTGGKLGEMVGFIGDAWNNALTATTGFFTGMGEAFSSGWENLKASVMAFATQFIEQVRGFIQGALDAAWSLVPDFLKIGQSAAQGLSDGFASKLTASFSVMQAKLRTMVETAKATLDVHSPSRVFMEIGSYSAEGLKLGLLGGIDSLADKIPQAMGSLAMAASSGQDRFVAPTLSGQTPITQGNAGTQNNNISINITANDDKKASDIVREVKDMLTRELQLTQQGAIR